MSRQITISFTALLILLCSMSRMTVAQTDTPKAGSVFAQSIAVPETGEVSVTLTPAEKQVPKRFRHTQPHKFPYRTKFFRTSGPVRVFKVQFPSPVKTDVKVNNTVHGDYFQPAGRGPFPGVVVLHILGGEFSMSRMIANGLARKGIAALFIKLPYYGERRAGTHKRLVSLEPSETRERFTQAVLDIRRAAAWLGDRPEVDANRLGLTGISLGGIMSALAGPQDPRFRKIAIYLGGGNLGEMVWKNPDRNAVAFRRNWLARGETRESFIRMVKPVDPLTYAQTLKTRDVLMVAAKHDVIVPPESTIALWKAADKKPRLVWLDAGHISAAQFLYGEMQRLTNFFAGKNWKRTTRGK
ncbi:MAG: hypothetical protein Tsb009_11260 [Planctomycetaceae bacterium]